MFDNIKTLLRKLKLGRGSDRQRKKKSTPPQHQAERQKKDRGSAQYEARRAPQAPSSADHDSLFQLQTQVPVQIAKFETKQTESLLCAVSTGQASSIRRLLQQGANPMMMNGAKISVLHIAAREGNEQAVQLLLEAGAVASARDPDTGVTPLHRAAERGHTAAMTKLLEAGADINARTVKGTTPLHEAARNLRANAIRLLLLSGATRTARDSDGLTAYQIASNAANQEKSRISPMGGGGMASWNTTSVTGFGKAPGSQSGDSGDDRLTGGLIYNEAAWDAHWHVTMEGLRRDPAIANLDWQSDGQSSPNTKRSQAISNAVDSGQVSIETAFALL